MQIQGVEIAKLHDHIIRHGKINVDENFDQAGTYKAAADQGNHNSAANDGVRISCQRWISTTGVVNNHQWQTSLKRLTII